MTNSAESAGSSIDCAEFESRLHDLLDLRQDPATDGRLVAHARRCEPCAEALDDWRRIGAALTPPAERPTSSTGLARRRHLGSRAALGGVLAACLLCGLWYAGTDASRQPPRVAESSPSARQLDIEQLGSRVAQPEWWGSVVRAAWEPVDPLAEGFRPLTNSLQTALELLTPRARASTVVPSPVPEDANVGIAVHHSRLV